VQQEIFGPVLPVATFSTLDEALALANDCEYGLTSSIFTRDLNAALRAANELKFGETYVNREHFEAMQGFHAGWRDRDARWREEAATA
jgi:lactaldehyde dehydrogenase/glycolaldehyde dehydrogenase